MKTKLTPWFPRKTNPARPGVYEIEGSYPSLKFSHFDGRQWNGAWLTVESADEERSFFSANGHNGAASGFKRWRGLATNPSTGA